MIKTMTLAATIALILALCVPTEAQVFRHKALFDAIDCTSLTGKKANQFCYELDSNSWWVCEPTSGDCNTAAEWIEIAGSPGTGAFLDSGDPVVLNTPSKDVVIGPAQKNLSKLTIDGDADQVQLTIHGHSSQTSDFFRVEDNASLPILVVTPAENVGIGTALAEVKLKVLAGGTPFTHLETGTFQTAISAQYSPVAASSVAMAIISGTTGDTQLNFGDTDSEFRGRLIYDNSDDSLSIQTAGAEAIAIDSSQGVAFTVGVVGKVDRNNVLVDEDDCTGLQSSWWYDTTDGRFEFCNAGAGAPAILAGGGGAGAFADAADPVVLQSVGKDVVIGPTQVNTSKLTIDGDADQVQLTIQGNGTQTADLFVIETSAGVELLKFQSDSKLGVGTGTPDNTLHVFKGSAGSVTGATNAPLVVEDSVAVALQLLSPSSTSAGVLFGHETDIDAGEIRYFHSAPNRFNFNLEGNIGMTLTAAGVLRLVPIASAPAACTIGDIYVDTSGAYCACTSTNTFSNMTGTGSCV